MSRLLNGHNKHLTIESGAPVFARYLTELADFRD